jgi:hypothetical protein
MAVDPGWRNCAGLWAAAAPDGTYVLYREFLYQGAKWGEIGDAIRASEGYVRDPRDPSRWIPGENVEDLAARWIDPHGFGMNEGGQQKLGNLLNGEPYNFEFCPSECDVLAGVEMCRRDLGRGIDGRPKMQVFSTCTRFIREIRSYRWKKDADEGRPEASDKPHKRDDHLMDCWRYLALQGLTHEALGGTRQETLRAELELAGLPVATGDERMIREHMEELRKRQIEGPKAPAHPGGLGTEW